MLAKTVVQKTEERKALRSYEMKRTRKTAFIESALTVPCPRRLQRQMFHNLNEATRSKLNLKLAKRAAELLAMIEAQSKQTPASVPNGCVNANALVSNVANETAMQVNIVSRPRWLVGTALKQCISRVSTFVKRNLLFQLAHGGQQY